MLLIGDKGPFPTDPGWVPRWGLPGPAPGHFGKEGGRAKLLWRMGEAPCLPAWQEPPPGL